MERLIEQMLQSLGEDPRRPGLEKTPARVAQSLKELTAGYDMDAKAILSSAVFESNSRGIVACRDIHFVSMCEHHLLPFFGFATIAYRPGKKLVGISKLVRILNVYARRLQVQERMGQQVLDAMDEVLSPEGILVSIRARHLCMVARGVGQDQAVMETLHMTGEFEDKPGLAQSFLARTPG